MRKISAHRFLAVVLLALCILSCSCSRVQEPSIHDVRISGIDIKGLTSADISVSVSIYNPNKKPLSAESASGEIYYNGTIVAEFFLKDTPLTAAALSTTDLQASINFKITDPLSLLSAGFNLKNPDFSQLTADADILIKIGDIRHKVRLRKYSLTRLSSFLNF